jgi:hypothetical protein
MPRLAASKACLVCVSVGLLAALSARADEGPTADPAPPPRADLVTGRITGDRVNLRVGPRIDNHPVAQLAHGTPVLVVEEVGDWLGVRVPGGFPVAVSREYLEPVGTDLVRVAARSLNLRVHPPREGQPPPGIFRDHPDLGALLTLVREEGDWVWVVAPEEVRAYVSKRYVEALGPASQNAAILDAARATRREEAARLAEARAAAASQASGMRLRETLGDVQQKLFELRKAGGTDKAPVVELANALDLALERESGAPSSVLTLARALREDLENEITLRVARHDAELARLQGLEAPAVQPLEEKAESFAAEGTIHFEPTPGWREEGVYILWLGDKPSYVLRLTTGGELPHPDFKANAGAGIRRVVGARPGERLFGLPVVDVRSIVVPAPEGGTPR